MEKYVNLELEVIELNNEDIICTSGGNNETPPMPWNNNKASPKPYEIYELGDLENN